MAKRRRYTNVNKTRAQALSRRIKNVPVGRRSYRALFGSYIKGSQVPMPDPTP